MKIYVHYRGQREGESSPLLRLERNSKAGQRRRWREQGLRAGTLPEMTLRLPAYRRFLAQMS